MKHLIDLRSDTVTTPTKEMREAMMNAKVGDDTLRNDPTVLKLESMAADILGKESAVFTVSGTMSNVIAVMTYSKPGDEIVVLPESHIYNLETGALSAISGAQARPLLSINGVYDSEALSIQLSKSGIQRASTRLICLENTFDLDRGIAVKKESYENIIRVAKKHSIPIFMDGARIFNAATALKTDVSDIVDFCDSVAICFSKGLSAPFGSILAGSYGFIEEARRMKQRLGGGMRQAGILAAAAIIGLTKMAKRLKEDHENAYLIRKGLISLGVKVDEEGILTNIINADFSFIGIQAKKIAEKLIPLNIKIKVCSENTVRIVTHNDITKRDVKYFLESVSKILME